MDTSLAGFWNGQPSMPRISDGDPGGLEVGAGGLTPHARRLFDASERPAQLPKCQDLPLFVVTQDVGHPGRGHSPPRRVNVLGRVTSLAGFQLSTTGRFWVSTEGTASHRTVER